MALVFNAPVLTDGIGDGWSIRGETAEGKGGFGGFAAVCETPGTIDAHKRSEFRPLGFLKEERGRR